MNQVKKIAKKVLPPVLLDFYKSFSWKDCVWSGNYASWKDAQKDSSGYDSDLIINKVKDATMQVIAGKACFERDSVLFYKEEYNFGLLSSLFFITSKQRGKLNLIDFGGSLGSTYYQHKKILDELLVSWSIVEQKKFVDVGKKISLDKKVKFFYDIAECKRKTDAKVLLLSSVLQYLDDPYTFISTISKLNFDYIIIDRTPLVKSSDRLTIQRVPNWIYPAKYPCWFFNETHFLKSFKENYSLIFEFNSIDSSNISSEFKGFLFKRKEL